MCDIMILDLKLSKIDVSNNNLIAWNIAKKIGILAFTNDLGINFSLHPDLTPYLDKMKIKIKPMGIKPIDEISFELVAGSLGLCICNAIPNDTTEPDPHPELSGIYKFLDELFKIEGINKIIIYFGPINSEYASNHSYKIPNHKEKPREFLHHFITNDSDQIIGIGKWGIFHIKP